MKKPEPVILPTPRGAEVHSIVYANGQVAGLAYAPLETRTGATPRWAR